MRISYQTFPDKKEYQSLLILNQDSQWKESLYFTFYVPWGEENEKLYAGRYMSDVHNKGKDCECVLAFDFHRWDQDTLKNALGMEKPPVAFEKPLDELLELALDKRESMPDGFAIKVKSK